MQSQNTTEQIHFVDTPPLHQVLQAINSIYHDSKNENKERASSWLTALQNSIYAWKVADELLIHRGDLESCYFAAQTLRYKLQYSFNELPAEAYNSLKDSIINHLKTINEVVIQTQLALCITYLAILVPAWQNPVEELVTKDLNRFVLVEILTLLPEELDQSRNQNLKGVGANRRQQFNQYLAKISPQIINLLNTTLQEALLIQQTEQSAVNNGQQLQQQVQQQLHPTNSNCLQMTEKLIAKIYRCLGAWINIIDHNDINMIQPLLAAIFDSLKDPDLCDNIHDAAADTICGTALLCENYTKYQQLTHYLLSQIYELESIYQVSVVSEEIDKSVNYSRIFTEMAESIVSPLIVEAAYTSIQTNSPNIPGSKIIDLLLHCIEHYDYEVAEITFHFWFRFSELIHKKGDHLLALFSSVANRLLIGLTRHCTLECDQEGLINSSSDLYEFRQRVRDLIKEVVFIVGAINYIKENSIIDKLELQLTDLFSGKTDVNWEDVEAQLFIISCIIRDLYDDPALVSKIVTFVLKTQMSNNLHIQIYATCCIILGEVGEWLEKNMDFLQEVLKYLLQMITNQSITQNNQPSELGLRSQEDDPYYDSGKQITLASIAANSLQQIIGGNNRIHQLENTDLVPVLIQICSQLDSILSEQAAHNLLQCCATIISTNINNNDQKSDPHFRLQQEQLIVQLLKPSLDNLRAIVYEQQATEQKYPAVYLDRISSVFRNLSFKTLSDESSFLNQLVSQEIWPLIDRLFSHVANSTDTKLVERSCRCLRCIIRCLKPVWLLNPIVTTIVNLYQANPTHFSYLYLASVLVDEFGSSENAEISAGLISMLNAFCLPTFQLLTAQESQLRNNPETIEDFFRLCTRFLQKNPERFLKESMLESILNLTVASIALDHREANKSSTKFLVEFFQSSSNLRPILHRHLVELNFGQRLTQTAVMGALFNLPPYFIPEMSDILWHIIRWDNKLAGEWLQQTLTLIPMQNSTTGVATIEPTQLEEFYTNVISATNPKTVAQSLRFVSRLYR